MRHITHGAVLALAVLPFTWGAGRGPVAERATGAAIDITEWHVPWQNTRPRDPFVGPGGRVWFCGQAGNYLAYLDVRDGTFKRFTVPDATHPHNLIVDGEGFVWYAGNRNAHIGKLDPASGDIVQFAMPEGVRDPHTLVFDANGDIWFTAQQSNVVGHLTIATGQVRVVSMTTPRSRPYGIVLDSSGHPWIAVFGTNRVATIDPATMKLREFTLPRPETRPRRIAVTSDGFVWYVDYAGGFLGRLDPQRGTVQEWATSRGVDARPYAMAVDDRDRIWFFETGPREAPNRLVGFDPAAAAFFGHTELESGGGSVRHMVFHRPTNAIWFGTDANTIGRAKLP